MKTLLRCGALLLLLHCGGATVAETLQCTSSVQMQDGQTRQAELKLTLARQRISGLEFSSADLPASGNVMGMMYCHINTDDPDTAAATSWHRTPGQTTVRHRDRETDFKSSIQIMHGKNGFKVSFIEMSRYFCGMTEFPKSIWIVKGQSECRVVYQGR